MPALTDLSLYLERSAALHKHLCPRQVLGVRMGLLAASLLGLDLPPEDKRLFVFVETDGCFADGVSVATGCWLGHRTMRLVDYGKAAATFVDTHSGQAVRISPHPEARANALCYAPAAPDHWHAHLAAYQVMPDGDLLTAEPVVLTVDLAAIISRPGLRVTCACCGEEVMNEREVLMAGKTLCRACAGQDRYYEHHAQPLPGRSS
jgi:formylmethanofuran dehydrogenase subunit E